MSKHIAPPADDTSLTKEHIIVIATVAISVPLLVLVSVGVVMCLKYRRKREAAKADEEARLQNEQNSVHSSMIKNTWGKSVNTDIRENAVNSDACCGGGKAPDPSPVYALLRTRSQKQLNTAVHRASLRASALLPSAKLDKECPDTRISVLSIDSSLCNSRYVGSNKTHPHKNQTIKANLTVHCFSEAQLVKRPFDKGSLSGLSTSTAAGTASSVYVIDEHFLNASTLATEV